MAIDLVSATYLSSNALHQVRDDRGHQVAEASDSSKYPSYFNREATITLELMAQASNIGHVMQHWNIYRKWNARLFKEVYAAFLAGRSEKDPSDGWYDMRESSDFSITMLYLCQKQQWPLEECLALPVTNTWHARKRIARNRQREATKK